MERQGARNERAVSRGFTLIELLVVMGIILFMIALVLLSVSSMLRSSRMSRAMALVVGAVDEARTAAITLRRSTKVDLTRVDNEGRINRLTVVGPFFSDNFDGYKNAVTEAPMTASDPIPSTNGWMNTAGSWVANSSTTTAPSMTSDGTRCLRMAKDQRYWNVCSRIDTVKQEDFEMTVMGRVKFLPVNPRDTTREVSVYVACTASVGDAYKLSLHIEPAATALGRNTSSYVRLDRISGSLNPLPGGTALQQMDVDKAGAPSSTTCLVENVWYRVSLSVKLISDPTGAGSKRAIVAGKVWADGQLEPWSWTCGPMEDTTPLANGPGGFGTTGGDALLDDVLFDARPTRIIPVGLRIDAMRANPANPESTTPGDWETAPDDSPFNFPILFRPDGTAADRYVLRITDVTSGDKRYVTIDQNSGRARLEHSLQDAIKQ